MNNEERAKMWAEKFHAKAVKAAGKGLKFAAMQAEGYVKFEASVRAPTRMVQPRNGGSPYPVATTRATPGAPLRIVSQRYQNSLYNRMLSETEAIVGNYARSSREGIGTIWGVVDTDGFNYPRWHEDESFGSGPFAAKHKTFTPAIERHIDDLSLIVGKTVKAEMS